MALELRVAAPLAQDQIRFAPVVQIARKEKNVFQRLIEWVGSLFAAGPGRQATRAMHSLFQKRIEIAKEKNDPAAQKAILLIQRFLTGKKTGGLEPSVFEQCGIPMKGLMDSVYLDLVLLRDPEAYAADEMRRLAQFRVQLLQVATQQIRRKAPQLEERCQEVMERAHLMTAEEVDAWIAECNFHRPLQRSKPIALLEEISSLMKMDGAALYEELVSHYLGALQIHERVTLKALPRGGLMRGEVRALEILTQKLGHLANGRPVELDAMEQKRVKRFLEQAAGNRDLNRRLIRYADAQHLTISKQALELALDVSYKMAEGAAYHGVMRKVDLLAERLAAGQPTAAGERLSLKQIKKVESLARLHEKFAQLELIGAPMRGSMVDLAARADRFVRHVLESAERERPTRSGSAMFYDYPNSAPYLNWPGGPIRHVIYNYLMPWPLVHASLAIRHEGQNYVSHMYHGHHAFMRRSIGDYAFKTFELDFTKVISDRGQGILRERIGQGWEREVERVYEEISHEIHTNKELLGQFHNPPIRQILAAMSIGYGLFDNHAMEHRPLSKQQICSSFVLNTGLAAMARLEERLKERCNQHGGGLDPLPVDFRFMALPIRRHRLLDFVLPHQLARRSLPLTREVDAPPVIRQVMNFHEFQMRA